MPFFPTLPDDAGVRHILSMNPAAGRALIEFHSAALRADSQLTAKDKELIAAYVSGLNACQYCYGVHKETAKAYGVPEDVFDALLEDVATAPIEPRLKPILAYAKVLTLSPPRPCNDMSMPSLPKAGPNGICTTRSSRSACSIS